MKNKDFVHLHLHDQFSVLDGYGSAKQYCERAKELGFKALALTNHGNIDGCIRFQKECKKNGIKPIFGAELYMVPDLSVKEKGEKRAHITVLARNRTGWENICKMLTVANINGYFYRPRIDPELLLDNCEGIVVGTACASSFMNWPRGAGMTLVNKLKKKGTYVYFEVMPIDMDMQRKLNIDLVEKSEFYKIPLVATNDCHYIMAEQKKVQEVLLAIQTKKKWNDPKRWKFSVDTLFLQSTDEMESYFEKFGGIDKADYQVAMQNSKMIADMCNLELEAIPVELPEVDIVKYSGMEPNDCFIKLIMDGWELRKNKHPWITEDKEPEYMERLMEEVDIICRLGFAAYFLIVYELINWCKENDVMTGPGRGSVGGSLVSYCMGITQVDPLKYGLVFSRFISEARIDLPDIDMDFEKSRRMDVIEHLKDLYGEYNIIGISNFMSMKGKSALKDAARVFDIPKAEVEKASDAIVTRSGGDMRSDFTITDAFETFEDGIKFKQKYPEVAQLAIELEGQIRGHGRHAAGICISKTDLRDGANCNWAKRSDTLCANWDKKDSEYNGLMKLDVLGLQSLDVLHQAQKLIEKNHGVFIDYEDITLDDPDTLEEFNRGNCVGIFQFNGNSIMRFCRDIGISEFEDIVALNALHRPGTLKSGTIHQYKDRKHGREPVTYPHPLIESITKPTQGIILYQEQVMRLMFECGGLPWRTTDTIRKAVSKSQGEAQLNKFKDDFVQGCLKTKTLSEKEANDIFETIKSFGAYGFNKCISGNEKIRRIATHKKGKNFTIEEMYLIRNNIEYAKKTGHKALRSKYMAQGHYGYGLSLSDGRCRKNGIIDIQPAGIRKVYKLTLTNNANIEITKNHKFPTPFGEKKLSDLQTDDYIYYCCEYDSTHKENKLFNFSGKEQICKGKKYTGKGFPKGKDNPGYIDGSYTEFQKNKLTGFCSKCDASNDRTERHHKDGNRQNNKPENIEELCSSCHKKADYKLGRTKRDEKGYPSRLIRVKNISYSGEFMTYDVTMDGPNHNFVTSQNIVTSNSHSVEYSLISYWQMWLRVKYPMEYMISILSYGQEKNKADNMQEARRLGLKIALPDINLSNGTEWAQAGEDKLLIPIGEIKGIGPAALKSIMSARKDGPFVNEADFESRVNKRVVNSKIRNLLNITYCWADKTDLDLDEAKLEYLSTFFNFSLSNDPMYKYRKLVNKIRTCIDLKVIATAEQGDLIWGYVDKITYQIKTDGEAGIAYSGCYGQLKDEEGNYIMMNFERDLYQERKDDIEHSEGKWVAIRISTKRDDSVIVSAIWYGDDMLKGEFQNFEYWKGGLPQRMSLAERSTISSQIMEAPLSNDVYGPKRLQACTMCDLSAECSNPVYPSEGSSNIMIIGESPNKNDDRQGLALYNNMIWNGDPRQEILGLSDFSISPNDVWKTTFIKCWPSTTKKPKKKHTNKCTQWLEKEIKVVNPFLILAMGNMGLKFFRDKDGGIMDASGDVRWNDQFQAFVVNIINPNILYFAPENAEIYNRGIMSFVAKYLELGWKL
jgi:uracil-DNA glycosylase family 4